MARERLLFEFDGDASKFKQAVKQSEKSVSGFSSNLAKVGGVIAGVFAVDKIMEFGSAVVETTSTFQRFESVLTNTLGSTSEAQKALDRITEFASQTPFSVSELTDSFVRLANQGFKPTSEEMRKLGDLASSTGKEFVMLAEAIIDAQVGEFERLKEFGIRAEKQGDKVTFTFKNVKTQVDFTSDAIQNYILSLGDLEGVSGAMVGISKTLGGQISNLGDSFDTLKNEIGEALMPMLTSVIGGFKSLFENITRIINPQKALLNDFKATKKELDEMNSSTENLAGNDKKLFDIRKRLLEQKYLELEKQINQETLKGRDAIIQEQQEFSNLVDARNRAQEVFDKAIANRVKENDGLSTYRTLLDNATIAVDNQKLKVQEATLAYESFKLQLENILEPTKETDEAVESTSESFDNLNTNAHQTVELLTQVKNIADQIAEGLSNVKRQVVETSEETFDFSEKMKSGFESIALAVGSSLVGMAFQADKSIKQIINSLSKMVLQMTIALVVATALRAMLFGGSVINIGKMLKTSIAVIAGAGVISAMTRDKGVKNFARGGIVTKPTMGIIGEAGQSEAVIPLNRLPQMMGTIGNRTRGEFTLRGQDLILALERAGDFRTRVTG